MKITNLVLAAAALFVLPAYALMNVGDTMPNLSWKTVDETTVSLEEMKGAIKVLLYNGGFCGPCNTEFSQLVPRVGEFDGKPVVFISLSVAGWSQSSSPTTQFLREWKDRWDIPFTVAAASRKEPYSFFSNPLLPNVVIVDGDNKLAYRAINPGVNAIFNKVKALLKLK